MASAVLNELDKNLESLTSLVYKKFKEKCYDEALIIIKNEKVKKYIQANCLDIVPIILKIFDEDFCSCEAEECIEEIFIYLAMIANQKEALLVFLEQIELCQSKNQFRVMVMPLQTILLKNVSTTAKSNTFVWVFKTLNLYLANLPQPSDYNLDKKERKLLDVDTNVENLVESLKLINHFYKPFFVKVFSGELIWPEKNMSSQEYLARFFLQLLNKPFLYLDIYVENNDPESDAYSICLKFIFMISILYKNPYKLLQYIKPSDSEFNIEEDKTEDCLSISQLSLSMYFYCVLGQQMTSELPQVYTNEYIFMSCLPCCNYLLVSKHSLVTHKGLVLFQRLLNLLHDESLPANCLDVPNHSDILKKLVKVMTYSESKDCRSLALLCFKKWLLKLQSTERYQMFINILSTVSHSGILGVTIHEIKENIRMTLLSSANTFTQNKLQSLLKHVCKLPDGERTDILEWSDKIMGVLNLLIYLCLSDPKNTLGYKSVLPEICSQFLNPLETGICISKAHYQLKLKDLDEPKSETKAEMSFNVGGEDIPQLSVEQEKQMVIQALNWFDIIKSIWARADKLIRDAKINHQ